MRPLSAFPKVYLYLGVVDFRKQSNGLAILVQHELGLRPQDDALFVFLSRDRKRIKMLYWDDSGFALWAKTLEKDRFQIPKIDRETMTIDAKTMELVLMGYDILKSKPHEKVSFERYS